MTSIPTTTPPAPDTSLPETLLNLLCGGPSYQEVAAGLLREALKKLYPTLDIDPLTVVVSEPRWDIVDDNIVELPTYYETLSDILAGRVSKQHPTLLIEGLHYLTQVPIASPPLHLPVRIEQIGRLINELAPAMSSARQEQQLNYWNKSMDFSGPRWHELSTTLRHFWNIKQLPGWTSTECEMARQVFLHPELKSRKEKDLYHTHAYLLDIDIVDGDKVEHVNEISMLVLIGKIDGKEVILTNSIVDGLQKFDSQEALGHSLGSFVSPAPGRQRIQWRLYEPDGNIFDQQACRLIAIQIEVIGSPDFSNWLTSDDASYLTSERPNTKGLNAENGPGLGWLARQMPDWLQAASTSDQVLFAQHLKNLSALSNSHAGRNYLDDIPPLTHYVLRTLKKQMLTHHPDASTLDLLKIEIETRSVVAWGTFIVPGKIETTRLSLVELALQNLIALAQGDKSIRSVDGEPLPGWMTVSYITQLITEVDIGRTYPELVKRKLLDDPNESNRRKNLYTSQLRIQLPMLALENKLRSENGIDEQGYRYVCALMEPNKADRKVDGQAIVIRQLAFVSEFQLIPSQDIVANMFVIGPENTNAGPCLLYRPLLDPQLCQYPSFSNLLYAIRETSSLRQSVLAWLPHEVHDRYSRYIFPGPIPSPWNVVDFLVDPFTTLLNTGPVKLSSETLGEDFMSQLFKANANAVVELANRQSVSNSENRWESFKQTGWLIFNLALPYLGGTVGTVLWLWQILEDVDQLIKDDERDDKQAKWALFVDLLMNMAMAVTAHALHRVREANPARLTEIIEEEIENETLPKPAPILEKLAPFPGTEVPPAHYESIHISGALTENPQSRAQLLKGFRIDEPEATTKQLVTEGVFKGLYAQGENRYVEMAGEWFRVSVDGNQVLIVDANKSERTGPPLVSDAQGHWSVDPSLRLRGPGSNGVRQKVLADARRLGIELRTKLNEFEARKPQELMLLTLDADELENATEADKEAKRDLYLDRLKTQRKNYADALKLLIEWPALHSIPDYARTRFGYLNAQVNFTFAEIDTLKERFTPALNKAMRLTGSVEHLLEQHIEDAQNMINVSDQMIERLDYMETRFDRFKLLGREGFEFVRQYRGKMPAYKSDQLRLLQLGMYRHLCLSLDSFNTVPEGWVEVGRIIDNVTVAFQSLGDAIDERSVIRLDEQIEALGSLTEQFSAIKEHLEYLGDEYTDNVRPEHLTQLGRQIDIIGKRALNHLALALEERRGRRSQATPYQQRPKPRKKFIRTRYWGIVSGEPQLSKKGKETDLLDVKNPFSDEIIATFHYKETGEWVARVKASVQTIIPALQISVTKANALINGLAAFKARALERVMEPNRTPTGNGLIIYSHASRMEHVSSAIKRALERAQDIASNETAPGLNQISQAQQRSAQALANTLENEARALYTLGFETQLNSIKQSPPTMNNIIWLKSRNQIIITKQKNRQRLRGLQYDYLDRYEIKDKNGRKTLWFADFYYTTGWVPNHAFRYANLRTLEQINQGIAVDSTKGLGPRQLIHHYRSEIAVDQAKEVFFTPQPY